MEETPEVEFHFFVWDGRKLFRTTEDGTVQGRWDPEEQAWVESGNFAYNHAFVDPDPDLVEIDQPTAMQAYPDAFVDDADDLLAQFEQTAQGLTEEDGEVSLSAPVYGDLLALAEEMLDASP